MNKLAHPEGEKNGSRACLKKNIIFNLSTLSTSTIKEVAESTECKALNWYQLYIKDLATTEKLFK
jgi:isopentenyl diphosphate isomerase/L-lactate dehydrogenase-like FMN-dependent dehydrogenase